MQNKQRKFKNILPISEKKTTKSLSCYNSQNMYNQLISCKLQCLLIHITNSITWNGVLFFALSKHTICRCLAMAKFVIVYIVHRTYIELNWVYNMFEVLSHMFQFWLKCSIPSTRTIKVKHIEKGMKCSFHHHFFLVGRQWEEEGAGKREKKIDKNNMSLTINRPIHSISMIIYVPNIQCHISNESIDFPK